MPPPDEPLVTVRREKGRRLIAAADGAARAHGLRPGMSLTHAQAILPGLAMVEAMPEADAASLARLAQWAITRYSPVAGLVGHDGLRIESAGSDHLFGGEEAMLADLSGRLARAGIAARAAVAGSHGLAYGLTRHAADVPIPPVPAGREREVLAALPLAALRLDPPTLQGLHKLGFSTVGEIAGLPRAPLARRFGASLFRRIDEALGTLPEPFEAVPAQTALAERCSFAEPIATTEQITVAADELCRRLAARMAAEGVGARRLDLVCHRVDSGLAAIRIGTAAPSRDAGHLLRLLAEHVDGLDPGFGIEAMTLAVPLAEPLGARQIAGSLGATTSAPDLSGLVDRLMNRFGPGRLYRLAPVESEVPERSVCRVGPLDVLTSPWPAGWPRPVRILSRPEPVETIALLPDHPPLQFVWRGTRRRVMRADGPERIFGEWWKRDAELAAVRDYFAVEDDSGARFWLFRAGDGLDPATGSQRWFLHGFFG
nr:DNA polymerase Y family protein [Methylobrevis pamukkalensis]